MGRQGVRVAKPRRAAEEVRAGEEAAAAPTVVPAELAEEVMHGRLVVEVVSAADLPAAKSSGSADAYCAPAETHGSSVPGAISG